MSDAHDEILRYRLDRAQEVLREAHLLAREGHWSSCVNRLYYACFYAVSALLLGRGLFSAKHTGVRSLFNQHFVKAGTVSHELGAIFNDLFENRQKGDYLDLFHFDGESVQPWIPQAERFVDEITRLAKVVAAQGHP